MIGVCFAFFYDAIGRSNEPISSLKFLLETRLSYESLGSFSDFPAFLIQKLWKKFQIFQEFPGVLAGISLINLRYFVHNFGTKNTRKSGKPS